MLKNSAIFSVGIQIVCCCFVLLSRGYTQEMLGITTDRFSGINRSYTNPASIYYSPHCIDISFLSGNLGLQNNFLYIKRNDIRTADFFNLNSMLYDDPLGYSQRRRDVNQIRAKQYLRLHGPSFLFQYKNHSFGFTNGLRTVGYAADFPVHIVNFYQEGLSYIPQLDIPYDEPGAFDAASMGWAEVGISYATSVLKYQDYSVAAGITVKRLWGHHAALVHSDALQYVIKQDREVVVNNINSTAYFSLPINYQTMQSTGLDQIAKGKGLSFDLGISYVKARRAGEQRLIRKSGLNTRIMDYDFYLGFSLLDIGAIRFRQNTKKIELNDVEFAWEDPYFGDYQNIDELLSDMENRLIAGSYTSEEGNDLWFYLPGAASMQFDYHVGKNIFTTLLWMQDLPLAARRVSRPSYVSLVPRYETRWFTLSLPFTLQEYTRPTLGISARFGFLTIGSGQPGGLLQLYDLEGLDFYFSLQWGIDCSKTQGNGNHCLDSWR